MIAPARVAAYDILTAVSTGRTDLPTAVAHVRATLGDERDRSLASEIATGVLRWRLTLDHVIADAAKRPLSRLDGEILEILRIGAYQLLHLSRVPASAVVDDAVDMARRAGKTSAGGLVNAVLRSLSRAREALPLPARPTAAADRAAALDYLSIALSHPRWLAARWYDRLGLATAERWMTFNNRAAPLTLRANTLRTSAVDLRERLAEAGVVTRPGRYAPDALIVESGHPLRDAVADEGRFLVQDEASQLVALLAGDDPGPRVLDACASPGGKATALAAAVHGRGHVVACDVRDRRMALLRKTTESAGADNIWLVQADLTEPPPFRDTFTCVLLDAPCSGLGTLRRDPDIKWRRQESDLGPLASVQARMLGRAAAMVAPGGRLVYATCSSEPEENEEIVSGFLRHTPHFRALDARAAHRALPPSVVDGLGQFRTSPAEHDLECFFGAVFERARDL